MWDLPGPGIEPESPALAGRFLTTGLPGKPKMYKLHTTGLLYAEQVGRSLHLRNVTDEV